MDKENKENKEKLRLIKEFTEDREKKTGLISRPYLMNPVVPQNMELVNPKIMEERRKNLLPGTTNLTAEKSLDLVNKCAAGTCAAGCAAGSVYVCGPTCGSAACCCAKTGLGLAGIVSASAATSKLYNYANQKRTDITKSLNDKDPMYDPSGVSLVINKSNGEKPKRVDKNYILNYIRENLAFPVNDDVKLMQLFEGAISSTILLHYSEPKDIFNRIDKPDIDARIKELNANYKKNVGGKIVIRRKGTKKNRRNGTKKNRRKGKLSRKNKVVFVS
jgi:hypothetical protein